MIARLSLVSFVLMTQVASAQTLPEVRAAVTRALPILQRSAATFAAQRACVSCHHNSLAVLTLRMARQRGLEIDAKALDAVEARTFRELRGSTALDDAVQAGNVSDPTPNDSYLLVAAHAAGVARDLTTGVYARRIARWQRDGHWITSDFRPPHSSSLFTATATAVRAVQFYLPDELSRERDAAIRLAREWLAAARPQSTEDAAFRLMGLAWTGASSDLLQAAGRELLERQRPDGGWPQLPRYGSDAYSTGEALYALHEAGTASIGDPARQKALRFLISTQARDGTWHVRTRMISPATVSPPYLATGFPYGKDEFLSFAGSCWAAMGLLSALPETVDSARPVPPATGTTVPWTRTVLFGSAAELKALLDAGLDPNSRTERGSTLLMMAAPDVDKVRLLVERGADVKSRGASGTDALTIAASHYGTSASIRALLDAGADVQRPARSRRGPLEYAAMTGDSETVGLLLSRGAEASAESLSESVTFGHPDVVRALVDRGVNVQLTESSGINLLHWAAITNRAAVIPVLVKAGVPLNATDDFGFTPLMYAATVDVGTTDTLKALLDAGADKGIRNDEGRTAMQQARRLKHAHLVDVLK